MVATIFSSLAFLFSSISMTSLSYLVATIISSLAFLFSSVSMTSLSHLVAASFSSLALSFFRLHSQPEVFVSDHILSLNFLSNSLSSPRFNLLRVARRCFSWSSFSDDLFFSSCNFLVILFVQSFHVLSLAILSSVLQFLKLCLF